jgi:UDP-GlcNAc:undecaprenyl-phosphate GlcNAc-1-phosphate transferase
VAVLSRIKRHISPFQGGQDHLSHRLIRAGLSRRKTAISLWALSALFAAVAILISKVNEAIEIWLIVGTGFVWIVLFILFFRSKDS